MEYGVRLDIRCACARGRLALVEMSTDAPPLVSVITPSFNQGRFIEQTILSVERQRYPNIEHIVIDGCSTDGTVETLESYPHLKWVSEKDAGQSDALNKGLDLAEGHIIAWLNSDDIYLPGAIEKAVEALMADPDSGIAYCNYIEIDELGSEIDRVKLWPVDFKRLLNYGNEIPQATVFIKREVVANVGGPERSYEYGMDYDWWLRIARKFTLKYVDDYWAAFRLHGDSKTARLGNEFWKEEREIYRRHGGRTVSRRLLRLYARAAYRSFRGSPSRVGPRERR